MGDMAQSSAKKSGKNLTVMPEPSANRSPDQKVRCGMSHRYSSFLSSDDFLSSEDAVPGVTADVASLWSSPTTVPAALAAPPSAALASPPSPAQLPAGAGEGSSEHESR
jgi:hypothetical protein